MIHENARYEFTQQEYEEIMRLVAKLEAAPTNKQKGIRDKLRNMGLYWNDFARREKYTTENVKKYFAKGVLKIVGQQGTLGSQKIVLAEDNKEIVTPQSTNSRESSDEYYVIDLCDDVLGKKASRQHRFPFLVGDSGCKLPVDAYYEDLNLVVEYHEQQHTDSVPLFDNKPTVSGVSRGEQRKSYDKRRQEVLPQNGIELIVISFSDFGYSKKLKRNRAEDLLVVKDKLKKFLDK